MDDKKRIEGEVDKIDKEGIEVIFTDTKVKFAYFSSDIKEGDKVYLRLFTEEDEKKEKVEIARELLNEVLNGEEKE